ncbi:MAG: hypothetical protein IPH83_11985 [Gammaproteobacteria bacterium]|nr:hypothetical protein [Gammaproteobacteria bacterium]
MQFLLYSRINARDIGSALGAPEYSYYFLLAEFRSVFEQLGTVTVIEDALAEADELYAKHRANGQDCVLVAFTAPHNMPRPAACPLIPLFAWEFERIPDEVWGGNPDTDWRNPLARCGRAITLSEHALRAVKAAMGEDFPVLAVPVPIWERMAPAQAMCRGESALTAGIVVDGALLSTRDFVVGADSFHSQRPLSSFTFEVWDGSEQTLDFRLHAPGTGALDGFFPPEPWGAWSRNAEVSVVLPWLLHGDVTIEIVARAYGTNQGRPLLIGIGSEFQVLRIGDRDETHSFTFSLSHPARLLVITGIDVMHPPDGTDQRTLGIGLLGLSVRRAEGTTVPAAPVSLDFCAGSSDGPLLHGFWAPDDWGSWSSAEAPWVMLPRPVTGRVAVEIELCGFGLNAGSRIAVYLGKQTREVVLSSVVEMYHFEFDLAEPAQIFGFIGVRLCPVGEPGDPRLLGIGLRSLLIRPLSDPLGSRQALLRSLAPAHVRHCARLEGVVYTSVLNPCDDRKNWRLLVSAFGMAFADCADATLVLKMTHHSQSSYLFEFHHLLQRMPPFACNIVLIHGFLDSENYRNLIARTDFYVNVSKAEGLCIPIMEFMICGKPAIAPRHTSLCDYLDDANSITVDASVEPCIWPHDEREVLRTLQYRVNPQSVVLALRRSHELLRSEPEAYRRMGDAAMNRMRRYCGFDSVLGRMRAFVGGGERESAVHDRGADSGHEEPAR